MSISRTENSAKKSILKRDGGLPMINVKNIASKMIKSLPGKPLELILVFAYITTALGELFGRDYGLKWYALLLLILAAFMVKELVEPKPIIKGEQIDFTQEKENNN